MSAVHSIALAICLIAQPAIILSDYKTLEKNGITVSYQVSEIAVAERSIEVLDAAIVEFKLILPNDPRPIQIVLSASLQDFAGMAGPYLQPGVAGVAFPEKGLICVKAPRLLDQGADFEGVLRHELVHVLLERNTNTNRLPRWLNEGSAMMASKEHRVATLFRVAQMYLEGDLIAYRDLHYVFMAPGSEMEFGNAYAQALSMTDHLRDLLGEDGFWKVIRDLNVMTFSETLHNHLGMTPAEFWESWRRSLWKTTLIFSVVSGLSLFQIMALLTVLGWWLKRRRGQRLMREWEEDEEVVAEMPDEEDEENDVDPWHRRKRT